MFAYPFAPPPASRVTWRLRGPWSGGGKDIGVGPDRGGGLKVPTRPDDTTIIDDGDWCGDRWWDCGHGACDKDDDHGTMQIGGGRRTRDGDARPWLRWLGSYVWAL
nr:unnamed protein product [Digitaria exilis]